MEPPLKSRLRTLGHLLHLARFGRLSFHTKPLRSIDRALPGRGSMVTCLPGLRQIAFAPSGGRV